jgi:hypothetical protein
MHHSQQRPLVQMRLGIVVFPTAIASVGSTFGVLKEGHPGQIVFELKLVEVHSVHRLDANVHKALSQVGDISVLTNNLPVEIRARLSPFAPKHDKHRLARLATQFFALFVVEDPIDFPVDGLRFRFFMSPHR